MERYDFKKAISVVLEGEKQTFDEGDFSIFDPFVTNVSYDENANIIVTLEDKRKFLILLTEIK